MGAVRAWLQSWRPKPRPVPPCPPMNDPMYLEWVAEYHPVLAVRVCASQALADVARRRADEERLRRIIREELART